MQQNLTDGVMELFFHFLMMATALLGFSRANKKRHRFKDFIHSPHVFVQKVVIMDLKEPVISLVFFQCPMTIVLIRIFTLIFFCLSIPFLRIDH